MPYTGAFVFGDSLVDSGNALKLANFYGGLPFTDLPEGAPYPWLGYFQGRFTNGYTFADLISNKTIGLVSKPVFPFHFEDPVFGIPIDPFAGDPSGENLNFAYGGAQIRQWTPVTRVDYRVGVPLAGAYREILNSDAARWGGSGAGNPTPVATEAIEWQGQPQSLVLTLPPLGVVFLEPVS